MSQKKDKEAEKEECDEEELECEDDWLWWTDPLEELSEIEDAFKVDGKIKLDARALWNVTPPHVIIYSSENPPPIVRLHEIFWETETYNVRTITNSTLQNFAFNQPLKHISFYLAGTSGAESFCNVTIPKSLLQGNLWTITMDDVAITDFTTTENITHTSLYFTYTHGSIHYIRVQGTWVIPEFPSTLILLMLTILTMLTVFFAKRKNPRKPKN